MDVLNAGVWDRALGAARELAELRELEDFPRCAAELLRRLIPSDHTGYNAIDIASGRATVVADPPDVVFAGGPETLARYGAQNPILVRAQSGDTSALRLSDHLSRRRLHGTDLYHHVYRIVGLEYQLGVRLPPVRRDLGRPTELVGLSLARSRRDFSDGERLLLEQLRPLLAATLERLHERALLRALASGSEDEQMLLVDERGRLAWAAPTTAEKLPLTVGEPLPAALRVWLRTERGRSGAGGKALVSIEGMGLHVRLIPGAYPGLDAVRVRALEPPPDLERLRGLGLTRRQAEVLALGLEGLTSAQIATRLTLSRRTVEHHFEAIYMRLGVTGRSGAIAVTSRALALV